MAKIMVKPIVILIISSALIWEAFSVSQSKQHSAGEERTKLKKDFIHGIHVETDTPPIKTYPTVKCVSISRKPENMTACLTHCNAVDKEFYQGGQCIDDVCYCHSQKAEDFRGHPTVRCKKLTPVVGEAVTGNRESCQTHCQTLGQEYINGDCFEGVCYCSTHPAQPPHPPPHQPHLPPHHPPPLPPPQPPQIPPAHQQEKCNVTDGEYCLYYCKTLNPLFRDARCVAGTCRCGRIQPNRPKITVVRFATHPTVKCSHLQGKPQQGVQRQRLCRDHCYSLGVVYRLGECVMGVCHCRTRLKSNQKPADSHPTVRCMQLLPVKGSTISERDRACAAHCQNIGKYLEGTCVEGVCRCRGEVMVEEVDMEDDSDAEESRS